MMSVFTYAEIRNDLPKLSEELILELFYWLRKMSPEEVARARRPYILNAFHTKPEKTMKDIDRVKRRFRYGGYDKNDKFMSYFYSHLPPRSTDLDAEWIKERYFLYKSVLNNNKDGWNYDDDDDYRYLIYYGGRPFHKDIRSWPLSEIERILGELIKYGMEMIRWHGLIFRSDDFFQDPRPSHERAYRCVRERTNMVCLESAIADFRDYERCHGSRPSLPSW